MQVDIPTDIDHYISEFARSEHISHDEAVVRLIEVGLTVTQQTPKQASEEGMGLFASAEDALLLDEVVALAYTERRRPSKIRVPI
jgi:hypothetical protein